MDGPKRVRTLEPGSRLGRYVIGERLARGGMAEVYSASQSGAGGFRKIVALKLVLPAFADDPEFRSMLLAEGRLSAGLNHPNIAGVLDVEELDGELFLALEYVHGRTVRALLRESETPPPLGVACEIALRCARALAYAHDHVDIDGRPLDIVHRDVSPSNLMVRYDGEVKLLDFGIAKASSGSQATKSGVLKGKGGYMAPEQCLGLTLDRRSDVFSLGIVLFELLTRRRLFRGDNDYEVMNRIVEGSAPRVRSKRPDVPEALDELVARALARDPADRFETASEMADALEAVNGTLEPPGNTPRVASYLKTLFGDAPPVAVPEPEDPVDVAPTRILATPSAPPADRNPKRPRSFALIGVAIAGVTLGGVAVAAVGRSDTTPSESRARSAEVPAGPGEDKQLSQPQAAPNSPTENPPTGESARQPDPLKPSAGAAKDEPNVAERPVRKPDVKRKPKKPKRKAKPRTGKGDAESSKPKPTRQPLFPWEG